ncbi:MAG: hypothetical protein ACO3JL_14655, partial [Myxococcota bacterium]
LLERGALQYRQDNGFHLAANDIAGAAKVRFESGVLEVDARDTRVQAGLLEWPDVAIPIERWKAKRWRIMNRQLDLENIDGRVSDGMMSVSGSMNWEGAGQYELRGQLRALKWIWPLKTTAPPFPMPSIDAEVALSGPLQQPLVSLTADSSSFHAYGYDITDSHAELRITRESLVIVEGKLALPEGSFKVAGALTWEDLWLQLEGTAQEVPLEVLLGESRGKVSMEGGVSGTFALQGSARRSPAPLSLSAKLTATSFGLPGVKAPGPLRFETNLDILPTTVRLHTATVTADASSLQVSGEVELPRRAVHLDIKLSHNQPAQWLTSLPDNIVPHGLQFQGAFASTDGRWTLVGQTSLEKCSAAGAPLRDISADLEMNEARISLENLSGFAMDGPLKGHFTAHSLPAPDGDFALAGHLQLTDGLLSSLALSSSQGQNAHGEVNLDLITRGTLRSPLVDFQLTGDNITIEQQLLGKVDGKGTLTRKSLQLQSASFSSEVAEGQLVGEGYLPWNDAPIEATIDIQIPQLSKLAGLQSMDLGGAVQGEASLGGTMANPSIRLQMHGDNLRWRSVPLGGGPLEVRIESTGNSPATDDVVQESRSAPPPPRTRTQPRESSTDKQPWRVTLSTRLLGPRGLFLGRAAYDASHQLVNARIDVEETDIGLWLIDDEGHAPPVSGLLSGRAHIYGPLERLDGDLNFIAPDIAFDAIAQGAGDIPVSRRETSDVAARDLPAGAVGRLSAQLRGGEIAGVLCIYTGTESDLVGPCGGGESVWVRTQGRVDARSGRFTLANRAYLHESRLERWVPSLRQIEAQVATSATAELRVERNEQDQAPLVEGTVRLQRMEMRIPGTPSMDLEEPAVLQFAKGGLRLLQPARFRIGDEGATLEGEIDQDRLRVRLQGKVLLAIVDVFTAGISAGNGVLSTDLQLEGSIDAPVLTGSLAPNGPATFEIGAMGEPIVWESGALQLEGEPRSSTTLRSQSLIAQNVDLRFRGGNFRLHGRVDMVHSAGPEISPPIPTRSPWSLGDFDVRLTGDSIPLQNTQQQVDASFEARLYQRDGAPVLSGDIDIFTGRVRDRFSLIENFLLPRPSSPPLPIKD